MRVHFTSSMRALYHQGSEDEQRMYQKTIFAGIEQLEQLSQQLPPADVMQVMHRVIDDEIQKMLAHDPMMQPSCRRGCNACCRVMVQITEGEARLLVEHATKVEYEDIGRLSRQAEKADVEAWYELAPEDKMCVFNKGGDCTVYEHRPMACRKYFVRTDPKYCELAGDQTTNVQVMASPTAELIATACGTALPSGSLPRMLLKVLMEEAQK